MFPVYVMAEKDDYCQVEGHLAFDMEEAIISTALLLHRLHDWGVRTPLVWAGYADPDQITALRAFSLN